MQLSKVRCHSCDHEQREHIKQGCLTTGICWHRFCGCNYFVQPILPPEVEKPQPSTIKSLACQNCGHAEFLHQDFGLLVCHYNDSTCRWVSDDHLQGCTCEKFIAVDGTLPKVDRCGLCRLRPQNVHCVYRFAMRSDDAECGHFTPFGEAKAKPQPRYDLFEPGPVRRVAERWGYGAYKDKPDGEAGYKTRSNVTNELEHVWEHGYKIRDGDKSEDHWAAIVCRAMQAMWLEDNK